MPHTYRGHQIPTVEFQLFTSSFCGGCSQTRALLEHAVRLVPRAHIREHNVADHPELVAAHHITSTPTVIVRDPTGGEVMRAEGVPTVHHLLVAADRALGEDNRLGSAASD